MYVQFILTLEHWQRETKRKDLQQNDLEQLDSVHLSTPVNKYRLQNVMTFILFVFSTFILLFPVLLKKKQAEKGWWCLKWTQHLLFLLIFVISLQNHTVSPFFLHLVDIERRKNNNQQFLFRTNGYKSHRLVSKMIEINFNFYLNRLANRFFGRKYDFFCTQSVCTLKLYAPHG